MRQTRLPPLAPRSLPLLHRLWRVLPADQRRSAMLRIATTLAPRPGSPPAVSTGIAVVGEFSRASGLGESARWMLRGLQALGVRCTALDIGPKLPAHRADLPSPGCVAPPAGYALALHVNPPSLPLVLLRLPRGLMRGRRVIGFWNWELPVVSPAWRAGPRFVHQVWTASAFAADALSRLVAQPVRIVPFPLALEPGLVAAQRERFGIPPGAVAVLVSANLGSSFARKNPLAAVEAFRAAFGERTDRLLILKTGNPDHFPRESAPLIEAVRSAPNIRLITETLSEDDVRALTASADIMLSLHRSEGFGLVIAEAMMQAVPVIATGWSANMEFMDADCAVPVPYRLVPVNDPRGVYDAPGARWAEPDVRAAAAALRQLADDAEARRALGARGRAAVLRLGTDPLADAVRALGIAV